MAQVWRLWKLSEMIDYLSRISPEYANAITVGKVVVILFFTAHYLGCMWFRVGPKSPDLEVGWIHGEGGILPRAHENWCVN